MRKLFFSIVLICICILPTVTFAKTNAKLNGLQHVIPQSIYNTIVSIKYVQKTLEHRDLVFFSSAFQTSYEHKIEEKYPNISITNNTSDTFNKMLYNALRIFPQNKVKHIEDILIKNEKEDFRGLAGSRTIFLNAYNLPEEELFAVMIHEICHTVDLGGILPTGDNTDETLFFHGKNPVEKRDASSIFYSISWVDNDTRKLNSKREDFVSGYATTLPFEDMAESCTFYVLHNKNFRLLAQNNPALLAKYNWIKKYVFNNTVFNTGTGVVDFSSRPWDTTRVDYSYNTLVTKKNAPLNIY